MLCVNNRTTHLQSCIHTHTRTHARMLACVLERTQVVHQHTSQQTFVCLAKGPGGLHNKYHLHHFSLFTPMGHDFGFGFQVLSFYILLLLPGIRIGHARMHARMHTNTCMHASMYTHTIIEDNKCTKKQHLIIAREMDIFVQNTLYKNKSQSRFWWPTQFLKNCACLVSAMACTGGH